MHPYPNEPGYAEATAARYRLLARQREEIRRYRETRGKLAEKDLEGRAERNRSLYFQSQQSL